MQVSFKSFADIPQFSKKDKAYVAQVDSLRPFLKYEVNLPAFEQVIQDKSKDNIDRTLLVEVLKEQYQRLTSSQASLNNIELLSDNQTFTVITAHQPSLFTGPLYYIYKIFSAINLAEKLKERYSNYNFVPVFITGGEDHDFEEINHTHLFGKTLNWENDEHGAVGMMQTSRLAPVLDELEQILGQSDLAKSIFATVKESYTKHKTYGQAAIDFTNELFKQYGLVVANMNHPKLKKAFIPYIKKEIIEQPSQKLVEATQAALEAEGFSPQAHARSINFFYLKDQIRERIVTEDGAYKVLNTDISFSKATLIEEIENHPERFSPNVVMRPIFQEAIFPNLAYIGGGGEIAYWFERKAQFEAFEVNFPMLIRRNSVLWLDKGINKKLKKLGITIHDLFPNEAEIIKSFVHQNASESLSLSAQKQQINSIFKEIIEKAKEVDGSLVGAVKAEMASQIKSIGQLEGRLVKAEKQRHEVSINQLKNLKDKLFPKNGLQERYDNFLAFHTRYGNQYFDTLKANLDVLQEGMVIISEE